MIVTSRDCVVSRYKLHKLKEIEEMVAEAVQVNIPFNNPITGFSSFTHKAGIHAKVERSFENVVQYLLTDDNVWKGDFGESEHVRNYRPCWVRHEALCALLEQVDRLALHQEPSWTAGTQNDWWSSQASVSLKSESWAYRLLRKPAVRTNKIKSSADFRPLTIDDTDYILQSFHFDLQEW